MSNSHYWLSSAEQAVMDAATGSASDYGYIAVTDASLDTIVGHSPFAISVRDYVSIADLTDVGQQYGAVHRFNLLRLNEFQKQELEADGFAFAACHPDPTGEYWGNIMLDLAKMIAGEHDHLCNPHTNAKQAASFIHYGRWGSTLASVKALGNGMSGDQA